MLDSNGIFQRMFTPVDGGYHYYPSKKEGAKFVTAEEYNQLIKDWERMVGRSGVGRVAIVVVLIVVVWTLISRATVLPEWSDTVFIWTCVGSVAAWYLHAALAPRRLVRDRPVVTPPRPASVAGQQVRESVSWPSVLFLLCFSSAVFAGSLLSPKVTITDWVWLVGSGAMSASCIWISIQKLRDKR